MEEILVLIIQIFFEGFFNAAVSLPFDWFFGWRDLESGGTSCLKPLLFFILGGFCGWLSLLVLPKLLIPLAFLRIINLLFSPLMAGGMSAYIASVRDKKATRDDLRGHFMNSFIFTLTFTAVRWAYSG